MTGYQRIDLEKIKQFSRKLFYKMMFQGPTGYTAQMCEVHLSPKLQTGYHYGNQF